MLLCSDQHHILIQSCIEILKNHAQNIKYPLSTLLNITDNFIEYFPDVKFQGIHQYILLQIDFIKFLIYRKITNHNELLCHRIKS